MWTLQNYHLFIRRKATSSWSFGVLLFEIMTLGGSPYPGIQPVDMESLLDSGNRMDKPDNCPEQMYGDLFTRTHIFLYLLNVYVNRYEIMLNAWQVDPDKRHDFTQLAEKLRRILESLTQDYSYLSLNQKSDYYNTTVSTDFLDSNSDRLFNGETGFINPAFELEQCAEVQHKFQEIDLFEKDGNLYDPRTSEPNENESTPKTGLMKFLKQANPKSTGDVADGLNHHSDQTFSQSKYL